MRNCVTSAVPLAGDTKIFPLVGAALAANVISVNVLICELSVGETVIRKVYAFPPKKIPPFTLNGKFIWADASWAEKDLDRDVSDVIGTATPSAVDTDHVEVTG